MNRYLTLLFLILFIPFYLNAQNSDDQERFTIQPGIFINMIGFTNPTNFGPFNFYQDHNASTSTRAVFHLLQYGAKVKTISFPIGMHPGMNWMVFPSQNYMVVRIADTLGLANYYKLYVINLETFKDYSLGRYGGAINCSLTLNPSQDGNAFFIYIGEGSNTSSNHRIIRSSDGKTLCHLRYAYKQMWQRLAQATTYGTVCIIIGPHLKQECHY